MADRFAKYKRHWDERFNQYERLKEEKFNELSFLAEELADYVYENYKVDKIYIFGSLLNKNQFWPDSDIDLAVSGLDLGLLYEVSSKLALLSGSNKVDLVILENCAEPIRRR